MDHFTKSRRLVRARNVYKSRTRFPRINGSRSKHQLVTACGSNKDGRSSGIFFDFLP